MTEIDPSSHVRTVAIVMGGRSAEHEISLVSGCNILSALEREEGRYRVLPIGITRQGRWLLLDRANPLFGNKMQDLPNPLQEDDGRQIFLLPGDEYPFRIMEDGSPLAVDVVFPILHGSHGEDGSFQGILEQLGVPFVGEGVLNSAVGMDKDVCRRLLEAGGIHSAKTEVFIRDIKDKISFESLRESLGLPFYVKPAGQGSSIGINRVFEESFLEKAITEAFTYNSKILIEENICGRELECAVLGSPLRASPIGEIIPSVSSHGGFYSYQAKYQDKDSVQLVVPAEIGEEVSLELQNTALRTAELLQIEQMVRVDMFLRDERESGESLQERILVNEVNTIPGFTSISMYPNLWNHNGLPLPDLLAFFIDSAQQGFLSSTR